MQCHWVYFSYSEVTQISCPPAHDTRLWRNWKVYRRPPSQLPAVTPISSPASIVDSSSSVYKPTGFLSTDQLLLTLGKPYFLLKVQFPTRSDPSELQWLVFLLTTVNGESLSLNISSFQWDLLYNLQRAANTIICFSSGIYIFCDRGNRDSLSLLSTSPLLPHPLWIIHLI